jgi:hypothetical protein
MILIMAVDDSRSFTVKFTDCETDEKPFTILPRTQAVAHKDDSATSSKQGRAYVREIYLVGISEVYAQLEHTEAYLS